MQIEWRELDLKITNFQTGGESFFFEKSHGNRNKSINSEMVKENPVNSIINDGKSRKEVYMIPKSILCREYNFVLTLKCKCLAMTNEAAH
jgi:hypothetical protein